MVVEKKRVCVCKRLGMSKTELDKIDQNELKVTFGTKDSHTRHFWDTRQTSNLLLGTNMLLKSRFGHQIAIQVTFGTLDSPPSHFQEIRQPSKSRLGHQIALQVTFRTPDARKNMCSFRHPYSVHITSDALEEAKC